MKHQGHIIIEKIIGKKQGDKMTNVKLLRLTTGEDIVA